MTERQIVEWVKEHMPAKLKSDTRVIYVDYEVYGVEYAGKNRFLVIPADKNGQKRELKDEEVALLVYLKDDMPRFGDLEECISYWIDE